MVNTNCVFELNIVTTYLVFIWSLCNIFTDTGDGGTLCFDIGMVTDVYYMSNKNVLSYCFSFSFFINII